MVRTSGNGSGWNERKRLWLVNHATETIHYHHHHHHHHHHHPLIWQLTFEHILYPIYFILFLFLFYFLFLYSFLFILFYLH